MTTEDVAVVPSGFFIGMDELLKRIPVCRRTLENWKKSGKIPWIKVGKRTLFHWPTVEAALLRLQKGGWN